jgi:hypothetical protein
VILSQPGAYINTTMWSYLSQMLTLTEPHDRISARCLHSQNYMILSQPGAYINTTGWACLEPHACYIQPSDPVLLLTQSVDCILSTILVLPLRVHFQVTFIRVFYLPVYIILKYFIWFSLTLLLSSDCSLKSADCRCCVRLICSRLLKFTKVIWTANG